MAHTLPSPSYFAPPGEFDWENLDDVLNDWKRDGRDAFQWGACPYFALALARKYNFDLYMIGRERFTSDWFPEFGMIPDHVFCMYRGHAIDSLGIKPLDEFIEWQREKSHWKEETVVIKPISQITLIEKLIQPGHIGCCLGDELDELLTDHASGYVNEYLGNNLTTRITTLGVQHAD